MLKVISFSLWGDNPTYTLGSIINAELAKIYYPMFECWFYIHKESVPKDIINSLEKMDNVKIIFKFGDINTSKSRMWRFEAIDDPEVEIMMSRMFGTRKIPEIKSWCYEMNRFIKTDIRMYDQDFLREYVYPHIEFNSVIHASFNKFESHSKKFPIEYDSEYRFVGEYVYYDESRSQPHINDLINEI